MDNAKVLVTGAAGFVGQQVVKTLLANGYSVVAYDDLSTGHAHVLPQTSQGNKFTFIKGCVTDAAAVSAAMAGCQHVVHLAAMASVPLSVQQPEGCFRTNVVGTETVLNAARLMNLPGRVLLASSAAVYGLLTDQAPCLEAAADPMIPPTPYAASKRMNEQQAHVYNTAYGLRVTCLRLFNIYGAGQSLSTTAGVLTLVADSINNGTLLTIYGDGRQTRDYIAVTDIALVMAKLLAIAPHQALPVAVNLGSGVATSLLDVIRHMVAITQLNPRVEYRPARNNDANFSCANISLLRQILPGWQPQALGVGLKAWLGVKA
jgi:UDP-glucose 4-epimerase